MKRTTGCSRLLSLPDEILRAIFQCLSMSDWPNIAFTCSRFHNTMKQAQLTLDEIAFPLAVIPRLTRLSKANYTCISCLRFYGGSTTSEETSRLLIAIGSTCPALESLLTFGDFEESAWRNLAERCRLLSMLEIHFSSPPVVYPPFDIFSSLKSLSLNLHKPASHVPSLGLCASLTSLTLSSSNDLQLSKLASSSSPLPPLRSLTLHFSLLTRSLSSLASFPNLASLSFHSCIGLDVSDLQALACSLHSLTHLTLDSCPLVSSSGVAAIAESNPKLTSLVLQRVSHLLLSPARLKGLLACCPQLSSLSLPSRLVIHPSLLADCSSLQSLSIKEGSGSLEGLALMLLRVEKASTDGGNSLKQEAAGNGEGVRQGGGRCGKEVNKALLWGRRGYLVRAAANAARQNTESALRQWRDLHEHCTCRDGSVEWELSRDVRMFEERGQAGSPFRIEVSLAHFKLKIVGCGLLRQVHDEAAAALGGRGGFKETSLGC